MSGYHLLWVFFIVVCHLCVSSTDYIRSKKRDNLQAVFIIVSTVPSPKVPVWDNCLSLTFAHLSCHTRVSAGLPKVTHLLLYSSWALGAKSQGPPPCADLVVTGRFGTLRPGLKHFCQAEGKQHYRKFFCKLSPC